MYRTNTELLARAEKLYQTGEHRELLNVLGEIDLESVSPDEQGWYNLLSAEASLGLGNFDFEAALDKAQSFYKLRRDDEKFARCKYLRGSLLFFKGDLPDAREELLESYLMGKRYDLYLLQARALNQLANVSLQLGEMETAELYLKKCIAIYGDLRDDDRRLNISSNLAGVYLYSGYIKKAVEILEYLSEFGSRWSAKRTANHFIKYAIPLALRGDTDLAISTIDKVLPLAQDYSHVRGSYHTFRGMILSLQGKVNEAKAELNQGLKLIGEVAPGSTLEIQLKRQYAEVLLDLNDPAGCKKYVSDALKMAEDIKDRLEIGGCYRVLGRLENIQGDEAKSREWFRKSFELFAGIGTRYELARARYQAASAGIFNGGERQALLYLAREYFESENISEAVERINRQLEDHPVPAKPSIAREDKSLPRILTADDNMNQLIEMAENVADSDISVLLTGATGTGKDLFARYIHEYSRRGGQFVSVNAAAIPDSMIESELFGHRKGAFTNADRDKVGLIEVAHNGTLYLNEIADASKELQAKLLDVLENHSIRRLGETQERQVSFRLIAATNHDLNQLIEAGRFRIDLFHRLSEVPISLPPLSERDGDIQVLFLHFLASAGVAVDNHDPDFDRLIKLLNRREWPGNVRQLEAEAKRLALLSRGSLKRMVELSSRSTPTEREHLFELLRQHNWNRREVARKLNVSDTTIRRKIKKFKLDEH